LAGIYDIAKKGHKWKKNKVMVDGENIANRIFITGVVVWLI